MTRCARSERRRLHCPRRPELLVEVPAVVVTVVMMVHISANALLRTFLDRPLPHTLEIVQFWYLPCVALLGFVAAQFRGQHISADLLYARLPRRSRRFVLCGIWGICAVLAAGFSGFGWARAAHAYDIGQRAGLTDVPSWPVYFLVPIAFGSLTVQFGVAAARAITRPEAQRAVGDPESPLALEETAPSGGARAADGRTRR